jgi:FkbM family methyltransferase
MSSLVNSLSRSMAIRRLVLALQIHRLGNWWLRRFPIKKHLGEKNVIYRATNLESIPLASEMFEKATLYDASLIPKNFTTFVDLGCNVGYFTCWLASLANGRKLQGLVCDANPAAVGEAAWHCRANQLDGVHALNGLVGEGAAGQTSDFYLYDSNICSTSHVTEEMKRQLKGRWTKISVPCLSVETEWRKRFGGQRCHLLKVDVEGSELRFLQAEKEFLKLVDAVLIEWHTWGATLEDLKRTLGEEGFDYIKTLEESETMGTAFFSRRSAGN